MELKKFLEAKITTLRHEAMKEKQCLGTKRKEAYKRDNILRKIY